MNDTATVSPLTAKLALSALSHLPCFEARPVGLTGQRVSRGTSDRAGAGQGQPCRRYWHRKGTVLVPGGPGFQGQAWERPDLPG